MLVAAALIFGVYEWGTQEWGTRTGAALAILVFVIVMASALTVMVVAAYRKSQVEVPRNESEQ